MSSHITRSDNNDLIAFFHGFVSAFHPQLAANNID